MTSKIIGILAGMGPRSTAPFIDLVVTECQRQYGATNDIDFPPMMIYSLPTPFYIDRPVDHAAMQATICAGLRHLAASGVAFIAMPCNSAHVYYDQLSRCINIPLLNMVDEAVRAIPASGGSVVTSTIQCRDYRLGLPRLVSKRFARRPVRLGPFAVVGEERREVGQVHAAAAIEIGRGVVAGITGAALVRGQERRQVGEIDVTIAVDVANDNAHRVVEV